MHFHFEKSFKKEMARRYVPQTKENKTFSNNNTTICLSLTLSSHPFPFWKIRYVEEKREEGQKEGEVMGSSKGGEKEKRRQEDSLALEHDFGKFSLAENEKILVTPGKILLSALTEADNWNWEEKQKKENLLKGLGARKKASNTKEGELPVRDDGMVEEEGEICSEMVAEAADEGTSPILPFPLLSSPEKAASVGGEELSGLPCLSSPEGKARIIPLPRYAA